MTISAAIPPEVVVTRVRRRFEHLFGQPPSAVGFAPGRVNLIGEHLDYNGGPVLPIALRHGTWAAVGPTRPGRLICASASAGPVIERGFALPAEGGWSDYVAGVLWAASRNDGWQIAVDSTVPIGAGLSSSAALECAVGAALSLSGDHLAEVAVRAEREYVGAPTGGMDQAIAVHGREDHALLIDFGSGRRKQIPFHPSRAGLGLLVVDTKVKHALADSDGGYAQRRRECEEAADGLGVAQLAEATDTGDLDGILLRRARHVISETARVHAFADALRGDQWELAGLLMSQSHDSLRDDFAVSCAELDTVVDTAIDAGALGARMTGGGFGGAAIVLAPLAEMPALAGAIQQQFSKRGWTEPDLLLAEAGPGAALL